MLGCIDITDGMPTHKVWSLTSLTRAIRQLQKFGCEEVILVGTSSVTFDLPIIKDVVIYRIEAGKSQDADIQPIISRHDRALWLRSTHAYDTRIFSELMRSQENAAYIGTDDRLLAAWIHSSVLNGGHGESDILKSCSVQIRPEDIDPHILSLRVYVPAIAADMRTKEEVRRAEKLFFDASVKGVMDVLYTYVYVRIVARLMRIIPLVPLTPNQITVGYLFIAAGAFMAYAQGQWALGLALSALTMICDAWDGVLARLTFQSSRLGHWLDKVSHSIYHPLWYVAIAYHLGAGMVWSWPMVNAVALIFLFFIMKPITIRYNRRYGRSIYDTSDLNRKLRLFSGTRWNMNMILMSAGLGMNMFTESFYFITLYGFLSVCYWLTQYYLTPSNHK